MPRRNSSRARRSAMFVTTWMWTHEWSDMFRRSALTPAACHHALTCGSALTASMRRSGLRLPRVGARMRMPAMASLGVVTPRTLPVEAVDAGPPVDALEVLAPALGPRESLRGALLRRLLDGDPPGLGSVDDAAGAVDGRAEPVAAPVHGAPACDADAHRREVLALVLDALAQVDRGVEQRVDVGGHEHRPVADRLDEVDRRARHLVGDDGHPAADAADAVRGQVLAEAREAGEVGEEHGHLPLPGQRSGLAVGARDD